LSRARNVGIKFAQGDVLGFPDDDCWYDNDVIERCLHIFEADRNLGALTGTTKDEKGIQSVSRFDSASGAVVRSNVWRRATSATLFCRRSAVLAVGGFDETLGVGSGTRWGSGEEMDYLLRLMDSGYLVYYDATFVVRHPQIKFSSVRDTRSRALPYARGFVHVLRKHHFPLRFLLISITRSFVGCFVRLFTGQTTLAAFSFWFCVGKLDEWIRGSLEA
jgi:glycosyltransferase involved in cell wall biosynthesis